jgi:protein SCO1/2
MQSARVGRRRTRGVLSGTLAVVLGACLAACGASTATNTDAPPPGQVVGKGLQGLILKPQKPAPTLKLRNYTGHPVSLSTMRGKAVLVTFVYTHCPNVCPLIVSNLAAAYHRLGPLDREVSIVAVTVDPRRDSPSAVRSFLAARDANGTMDYLLGSLKQMRRVWKAWDVGVSVDTKRPIVGHSAIVYGITASGRVAVVYPSNFSPAQIVHDVPLLVRA